MNYLQSCSCVSSGDMEDIFKCAPCPPPFLTYMQLKLTAVGKLCQRELCSIARRCNMSESPALTTDCPDHKPSLDFKCELVCIIMTASAIFVALTIILIILVVRRRRDGVRQDTINVVFNDTDSEASGKSSDRGSIDIVQVQADCHDDNGNRKEDDKDCQDGTDQLLPPKVICENSTSVYGNEPKVHGKDVDSNGHSQETVNGLRSRANVEKNETCGVAKI